ncbi:cell division protein FtsQ [Caloramator quimbayensis]|uniref:Cell division protein FtsQ n=1 Tax=Caloramator quimbayensis TaxID=1147123 RepID=A0A1T4X1H8_9CLOT|nr:FtsQ-type POTRA domain-containing protein [Caloramator quimbayensis]SKA83434.1 cell division protein FtsQ [Caloramator quimbayensis]
MVKEKIEKKIRKRKLFLKLCFLLIFLVLFLSVILKSDYFLINNIVVKNNKFIKREEIIALCEAKNQNIFLADKNKMIDKIENNPYVESVNIKKKLPSTIIIDVKEKKVKGIIKFENTFINLDGEGNMIQTINQFPDGSIPLIEGITVKQYVPNQNIAANNTVLQKALKEVLTICDFTECKNTFCSVNLSNPYKIILTTKDGVIINIGDWSNFDYKLSYAFSILKDSTVKGSKGYIEILPEGTAVFRSN